MAARIASRHYQHSNITNHNYLFASVLGVRVCTANLKEPEMSVLAVTDLHEPSSDVIKMSSVESQPKIPEETPDNNGELIWNDDDPPAVNYNNLGQRLARSGDLYRGPKYGDGLILQHEDGTTVKIMKGADLAPVIVDRVLVRILKEGKAKGGQIAAAHLNAMLRSRMFLDHFLTVEYVTNTPMYLSNFSLTHPGYNDGDIGNRILYEGDQPAISDSLDHITAFLEVMDFESNADCTNAVAGLLTVALRNHWPGGKPILVVTATKSHAGKDTVIMFAAGVEQQCSISYQSTNWALERNFVGAIKHNPLTGLVSIENARLDGRDRCIASSFAERFATDPEPLLFSTGTGEPVRRKNDIVLAISTNFGSVSEDIMNRSLPIHLNPVGNVADRHPSIGNPKLEYLPTYREQIAAEARGMIERWKVAGQPLDRGVRHPFSTWAEVVGGILKVNGFTDFLANYSRRKTADDPLREALGILGAKLSDEWHRPAHWADVIAKLGLTKRAIPQGDQDSDEGRRRGAGVVLSAHRDEVFHVETEDERITLKLERRRTRCDDGKPHVQYRFAVVERESLEGED